MDKIGELYEKLSQLHNEMYNTLPPSHEGLCVLDRLTEAGMWLRLVVEINLTPKEIKAVIREKDQKNPPQTPN